MSRILFPQTVSFHQRLIYEVDMIGNIIKAKYMSEDSTVLNIKYLRHTYT